MNDESSIETSRRLLLALYPDEPRADSALQRILSRDISMDRISILGKAGSSGDDPLGVYYPSLGERMVGWGKMGAIWGGLFGMLSGAVGLFLIPGIGPIVAAGPVAEALVGAAGGAGLGGGALAGAVALSQFGVAVHRMGIPEDEIETIQQQISRGHYLLMLITDQQESAAWRQILEQDKPETILDFPYVGFTDALRESIG